MFQQVYALLDEQTWRALALIPANTWATVYMVAISCGVGTLLGAPLGVWLATSGKDGLFAAPRANRYVAVVANSVRSVPYIILLLAIIPFTRLVVGTMIGTTAATVPLTLACVPFIARIVETAVREVDQSLVEAAKAMGATPLQIVRKVLVPEAMPAIVSGLTLTVISLIGYSAMAGAVGGGGLGDLALRYGYQRYMPEVMVAVVIILILMVQAVQTIGDQLARRVNKRQRAA